MTFINEGLISRFHRFLARFSGRRRGLVLSVGAMRTSLLPLFSILAFHILVPLVEGCSRRMAPKTRPPATVATPRPNITFHTDPCPPDYDNNFCINGGTCFVVKIGTYLVYNCACSRGYTGQRCEYKNLDGSYSHSRHGVMLETASIASGATIAVFLVVMICFYVYMKIRLKHKENLASSNGDLSADLEMRTSRATYTSRKESPRIPLHHMTREGGSGDGLNYTIYAETEERTKIQEIKEPP